jgi:hypothetical protein
LLFHRRTLPGGAAHAARHDADAEQVHKLAPEQQSDCQAVVQPRRIASQHSSALTSVSPFSRRWALAAGFLEAVDAVARSHA